MGDNIHAAWNRIVQKAATPIALTREDDALWPAGKMGVTYLCALMEESVRMHTLPDNGAETLLMAKRFLHVMEQECGHNWASVPAKVDHRNADTRQVWYETDGRTNLLEIEHIPTKMEALVDEGWAAGERNSTGGCMYKMRKGER